MNKEYYYEIKKKNIERKRDLTTTLSSFTDGLIPSVTAMKSVGKNNTDGITDGTRPSVKQSSVNPISVANSVANKKTTHRRSYRRIHAAKKKFPTRTLPTDYTCLKFQR